MSRIFIGAASAAALLVAAGAASAQDQNWSGPYAGISVGYGPANVDDSDETVLFDTNLDGTFSDTVNTAAGANAFSPGFCDGAANGPTAAGGCDSDHGGFDYGVRLGYDWRFGNIVAGGLVEGSFNNTEDSVTAFSTTPAFYTFTRSLEGILAARARVGYAFGDNLVYATGGYAYGDFENSFTTSNGANTFSVRGSDGVADGWQAGGGYERQLAPNLRAGVEYIYTSLQPDRDYTIRAGGPAPAGNPFLLVNAAGTDMTRSSDDFNVHAVKLMMTYSF